VSDHAANLVSAFDPLDRVVNIIAQRGDAVLRQTPELVENILVNGLVLVLDFDLLAETVVPVFYPIVAGGGSGIDIGSGVCRIWVNYSP
jgi:hypothetical protein